MGIKRIASEAIPKPPTKPNPIFPEMQIHPPTQKPLPNGRHPCFPSISMGRTLQNAHETPYPSQIKPTKPQMP